MIQAAIGSVVVYTEAAFSPKAIKVTNVNQQYVEAGGMLFHRDTGRRKYAVSRPSYLTGKIKVADIADLLTLRADQAKEALCNLKVTSENLATVEAFLEIVK